MSGVQYHGLYWSATPDKTDNPVGPDDPDMPPMPEEDTHSCVAGFYSHIANTSTNFRSSGLAVRLVTNVK